METYPIGLPSCEWSPHPWKPGHYFGTILWTPTNQDEYYRQYYADRCASHWGNDRAFFSGTDEEWKRRGPYVPTEDELPSRRPDHWREYFGVGKALVFRRKDGSGFGCNVQYGEEATRWGQGTYSTPEAAMKEAERLLFPLPAGFTLEEWTAI
jgi:hypothetical protein